MDGSATQKTPANREWRIGQDAFGNPPSMQQLSEAMLEVGAIIGRCGGIMQVVADRVKYESPGEGGEPIFVTEGYVFRWFSYAPVRTVSANGNGQPVEEPPEQEPEEEPLQVGDPVEDAEAVQG